MSVVFGAVRSCNADPLTDAILCFFHVAAPAPAPAAAAAKERAPAAPVEEPAPEPEPAPGKQTQHILPHAQIVGCHMAMLSAANWPCSSRSCEFPAAVILYAA
jgi:hypothetical protein